MSSVAGVLPLLDTGSRTRVQLFDFGAIHCKLKRGLHMTTPQILALLLVGFVFLMPVLWGLSTWLWLSARRRMKVAVSEAAQLTERSTALQAELAQFRGQLAAAESELIDGRLVSISLGPRRGVSPGEG